MSEIRVWEILVPSHAPDGVIFSIEYHKVWDRWICKFAGGVTLYPTVKGRWGVTDLVVVEKMIPVRVACTEERLQKVLEFTGQYYRQGEVMAWMVSDEVQVWRKV